MSMGFEERAVTSTINIIVAQTTNNTLDELLGAFLEMRPSTNVVSIDTILAMIRARKVDIPKVDF